MTASPVTLQNNHVQGEFIELPHSGSFVPVPSFAGTSGRKQKNTLVSPNGLKEIEIRTPVGDAIRICGEINEKELFSIIQACSHVQP